MKKYRLKKARWKPEIDEKYWFFDDEGDIDYSCFGKDFISLNNFKFGNTFKSQKDAKFTRDQVKELLLKIQKALYE